MNERTLRSILPFLRCPKNHDSLTLYGNYLVSTKGEKYPIIDGKPILVREVKPVHLRKPVPSIVSQNISEYTPPPGLMPGLKIHLGSGNVPSSDPEVISIDVLPNTNVDIVAEAESLPFASDSLASVYSSAVFEHLYDPIAAAKEVRRVLAPGGTMFIDTAFLQGYHGFPSHYFNMTSQAVETFIVDGFELISSKVPPVAGPACSVGSILQQFIEGLPLAERERLLSISTRELLECLSNPHERNALHDLMSEHLKRTLAASTRVVARKPAFIVDSTTKLESLKRDYYALRVGVIQRHHELEFYCRRTLEKAPQAEGPNAPDLHIELINAAPANVASIKDWDEAIARLTEADKRLTSLRDIWIDQYLQVASQ